MFLYIIMTQRQSCRGGLQRLQLTILQQDIPGLQCHRMHATVQSWPACSSTEQPCRMGACAVRYGTDIELIQKGWSYLGRHAIGAGEHRAHVCDGERG